MHVFAYPDDDPDPARAGEPADPFAPRRVFDHWSGDTAFLRDPNGNVVAFQAYGDSA